MTSCFPVVCALLLSAAGEDATPRPNILFCISDDQSWCHTGIGGDPVVRTPVFDRMAREGVLFRHAYCASPSCAPSRAAVLTGRPVWQLEEGANMRSHLPAKFVCYTDLLEKAGYHVGYAGKGWGPGKTKGRTRNPAGPRFKSFAEFLAKRPADAPFCFWFGSSNPHRPYPRSYPNVERRMDKVRVPPYLPDTPEVRRDLLDYLYEIEQFDRQVGGMIRLIESQGLLDNTLVVVTSDNGMPFPRGKCNLYDWGTRMPLAVRWADRVPGGRTVDDFLSFTDFAPTFLEAAGLDVPAEMAGRSFLDVLLSDTSGQVDPTRDAVFTARERHSVTRPDHGGYPIRAIRTHRYLYLQNFRPDRGPTGTPPGSADLDNSPTKSFLLTRQGDPAIRPFFEKAFARRPAEELYDLRKDPHQWTNVAETAAYAEVRRELSTRLMAHLKAAGDPRAHGRGDVFDGYPFWTKPADKIPVRVK